MSGRAVVTLSHDPEIDEDRHAGMGPVYFRPVDASFFSLKDEKHGRKIDFSG